GPALGGQAAHGLGHPQQRRLSMQGREDNGFDGKCWIACCAPSSLAPRELLVVARPPLRRQDEEKRNAVGVAGEAGAATDLVHERRRFAAPLLSLQNTTQHQPLKTLAK